MVRGLPLLLLCQRLAADWLDLGNDIPSFDESAHSATTEHRYYVIASKKVVSHEGEHVIDQQPKVVQSEQDCMNLCDQDVLCDCAIYWLGARACQRWGGCQRHTHNFVKDMSSNTLMKVPKLTPEYGEYKHYASQAVQIGGSSATIVTSEQECQDRCTVDFSCECAVWAQDGTSRCWTMTGCQASHFRFDPIYVTFLKNNAKKVHVELTTTEEVSQWVPVIVSDADATTEEPTKTTEASHASVSEAESSSSEGPSATSKTASVTSVTTAATTATTTTATTTTTTTTTSTTSTTTTTTTTVPGALLVMMTIQSPMADNAGGGFLGGETRQAAKALEAEMEEMPFTTSLRKALAVEMDVQESDVLLLNSETKVQVAASEPFQQNSMAVFVAAKVLTMSFSMGEYESLRQRVCPEHAIKPQTGEMRRFIKSWGSSMSSLWPEEEHSQRLSHLKSLGQALQDGKAKVVEMKCSKSDPPSFDLGAALQSGASSVSTWLHEHRKKLMLALLVLLGVLLVWAAKVYGPRGYQKLTGPDQRTFRRTLAQRFESRSARMERVKSRVEKYAERAFDLVMAAEPDYEDTELQYYVNILDGCKGHAKAICGSPWGKFYTPGDCEICKRRIDRKEKGCQCTQGGHRLCWNCMASIMNWESLAAKEGQQPWTWSIKDWL